MKKIFFTIIILAFMFNAKSQTYSVVTPIADSLRDEGDLNGALKEYRKAYTKNMLNEDNMYEYACLLSIMGQKDSCFNYLYRSIKIDTSYTFLVEPDFVSIKGDKRWDEFEDKLIYMLNIKYKNSIKDIEYAKELWAMDALDQEYYSDIDIATKKIGANSTVVIALWNLKDTINKKNQKELERLIETKGWPKISDVGKYAAKSAFLIIQHSDLEKQKKYLPTIEQSCEDKEAIWENYALMYDRVQVYEKKPQKYGSQVKYNEETKTYELFPLIDATKVDEWRKAIGMQPLEDYLSHWDIKFESPTE